MGCRRCGTAACAAPLLCAAAAGHLGAGLQALQPACRPHSSAASPVRLKQLLHGVGSVAQQRGGARELLVQHRPRLAVHGAPQVVAQLKGVLDAHLGVGVRHGWVKGR